MSAATSVGASVALLAGLVAVAGPAAGATACTPRLQVLGTLPQAGSTYDAVRALGKGNLAVGTSAGKPVYWTGTTVHRVPLPGVQDSGELVAANASGLMVGRMRPAGESGEFRLFTYRAGDPAVTLLPDGLGHDAGVGVNDAGLVVGGRRGTPVVRMWQNGAVLRDLTVPAEAGPAAFVETMGGINARGDVVATLDQDYEAPDGSRTIRSVPVLWPGDGGPAKVFAGGPGGGNGTYSWVEGISSDGTVVGSYWYGPGYQWKPWVWTAPYDTSGTSPAPLKGFPYTSFEGISANTHVSVGIARFHPDEPAQPDQAVLWKGSGDILALPRLAAGKATAAAAVNDEDRVGGSAVNATGKTRAVVWTCASKQAYLPQ
jgi:uncharacterized membrane protein